MTNTTSDPTTDWIASCRNNTNPPLTDDEVHYLSYEAHRTGAINMRVLRVKQALAIIRPAAQWSVVFGMGMRSTLEAALTGVDVVNNAKCIVQGCVNRKTEGRFVGTMCAPCYHMITTGELGFSDSFLGVLRERVESLENALMDAWGVIANSREGQWEDASPEWLRAAKRWRDESFTPNLPNVADSCSIDPPAALEPLTQLLIEYVTSDQHVVWFVGDSRIPRTRIVAIDEDQQWAEL